MLTSLRHNPIRNLTARSGASLGHDNRSDIVVRGVAVSSGRLEGAFRIDDTGQSVGRSR